MYVEPFGSETQTDFGTDDMPFSFSGGKPERVSAGLHVVLEMIAQVSDGFDPGEDLILR